MSKPVIATVGLLYAINYWNNYFHAMMYTRSPDMNTLQVYLYNIINNSQDFIQNLASNNYMANITSEGMVAAAVTLSIIPIVALYPFVVRHGHIRHQPKHGGRKRPRIEGPGQRNIKASGV